MTRPVQIAAVTCKAKQLSLALKSDRLLATLHWLECVAESDEYTRAENASAAEIKLALVSPGYRPNDSAMCWLRREAQRSGRHMSARWARCALERLEA